MKRTPLYERHIQLGARMVPFAGWEMPLQYQGILAEHKCTRTSAGLFDVSHMGEISVSGPAALDFLQKVTCNDVSVLKPGKVQYSALLNDAGGVVDDCTVYHLGETHYWLVVNAATRVQVWEHLQSKASESVTLEDVSERYGLLALQGPEAESILSMLCQRDLSQLKYFEWQWVEFQGLALLVSRTGYTGEDGFEIYLPWEATLNVWDALLLEGKSKGLAPIGLGARDTLRLEMGYLLSGTDMGPDVNAWEAGLAWICKFEKGSFVGRSALLDAKPSFTHALRGLRMVEKGIPRQGYAVSKTPDGRSLVGRVTSGAYAPSLALGIGLVRLAKELKFGSQVFVECRPGQWIPARVQKPPFLQGSVKKT